MLYSSLLNHRLRILILEAFTAALADGVQLRLHLIEFAEARWRMLAGACGSGVGYIREEEDRADDDGGDAERAEEPCEPVLDVDRGESKVQRGRQRGLELREGHDDGFHALGCLRERVLERRDRSLWRPLDIAVEDTIDVRLTKISDMATRMYGPDTTQTLMFTNLGLLLSSRQAEGWLSWQGDRS